MKLFVFSLITLNISVYSHLRFCSKLWRDQVSRTLVVPFGYQSVSIRIVEWRCSLWRVVSLPLHRMASFLTSILIPLPTFNPLFNLNPSFFVSGHTFRLILVDLMVHLGPLVKGTFHVSVPFTPDNTSLRGRDFVLWTGPLVPTKRQSHWVEEVRSDWYSELRVFMLTFVVWNSRILKPLALKSHLKKFCHQWVPQNCEIQRFFSFFLTSHKNYLHDIGQLTRRPK